ncbi:hypothetical protein LCGC14_0231960 [marine sediment metagenome]|uniref:Uncharacterized protein n=1 Tax=marine sediment metagenome TaxID=412755 RepID=A0A0F9XE76_9ZZZZ
MPAWPANLPQNPLLEGYQEQAPNLSIRTQMDSGPAKVRKRFTSGVRSLVWNFILGSTEVDNLDAFYLTTIEGGSLSFTHTDPRTGTTGVSYRIVEAPTYVTFSNRFKTSLKLEMLP